MQGYAANEDDEKRRWKTVRISKIVRISRAAWAKNFDLKRVFTQKIKLALLKKN